MALKVITLEDNSSLNALDLEYWTRHSVPSISSLLASAGSYSPSDQEAHLEFLAENVLPNLGPRPSVAHTNSFLTQSGSPIQPSLNISSGKPQVRYCWELLGPTGGSDSDPFAVEAAREILSSLSLKLGFSTQWSDDFVSAFALTPEEAQDVQAKLPAWLASFTSAEINVPVLKRLPFSFVAFDLKGPETSIKAYFNPKAKEIATGISATETTWDVLRNLKPALNASSIDILIQFFSDHSVPSIELMGVDCVDDAGLSDARVKVYVHAMSNSFNTVRDYVTLGGQIQDETTLKGLELLHDIWHLLLQEPEGLFNDDYSKPVNDGSMLCQRAYFSFELRPNRELPEVKTYLPTWNYVRSDEETVRNYEEVFRKCGQALGEEGSYKKVFEDAFGPVKHDRKKPVHCDASFLYNQKKGIYQTLYFSPPMAEE